MKKVTIKNKLGVAGWGVEMADPTAWIAECVASCAWGKPERWVLHKDEAASLEAYDEADVLEEKVEEVPHSLVVSEDGQSQIVQSQKWVKLKAEYTVEIEDITAQHALAEVIAKRVAEYPSAEEFLNAYFDGGQAALDALQAARLAVKAKYPKP
jgi:hypothetical protein